MTSILLSRQKTCFIVTNTCLSRLNFCPDINDTCGSSRQWSERSILESPQLRTRSDRPRETVWLAVALDDANFFSSVTVKEVAGLAGKKEKKTKQTNKQTNKKLTKKREIIVITRPFVNLYFPFAGRGLFFSSSFFFCWWQWHFEFQPACVAEEGRSNVVLNTHAQLQISLPTRFLSLLH